MARATRLRSENGGPATASSTRSRSPTSSSPACTLPASRGNADDANARRQCGAASLAAELHGQRSQYDRSWRRQGRLHRRDRAAALIGYSFRQPADRPQREVQLLLDQPHRNAAKSRVFRSFEFTSRRSERVISGRVGSLRQGQHQLAISLGSAREPRERFCRPTHTEWRCPFFDDESTEGLPAAPRVVCVRTPLPELPISPF